MKHTFFALWALLFASVLYGQKTEVDAAYTEACNCISALDKKKLGAEEKRAAGINCMQEVMMKHIVALAKDNGYEMDDLNEDTGRIIGEKFGQTLVTKCPASIPFFVEISKDEIESGELPKSAQYIDHGEMTGTLLRMETTGDAPKLVIKLADGSEEAVYWIRPFSGADQFETGYKTMIGKTVTIEWGEFRKYVFSMKGYAKVREIISLQLNK